MWLYPVPQCPLLLMASLVWCIWYTFFWLYTHDRLITLCRFHAYNVMI